MKYIPLPACLPCPAQRERQHGDNNPCGARGKRKAGPPPPDAGLVRGSDRKTLSPAILWARNCFERPLTEAGCWATVNAFIFLMAMCAMIFAPKKGPFELAGRAAGLCQGPWPASEECGHKSEQGTRPVCAALRSRFQAFGEKSPTSWGKSPLLWGGAGGGVGSHYASAEELGRVTLMIFIVFQLFLLLSVCFIGAINSQAFHCQRRNRGAPGNEPRQVFGRSGGERGSD